MASDDAEFREAVREVVKRHDPDASDLRALSADLQGLADRFEEVDETL